MGSMEPLNMRSMQRRRLPLLLLLLLLRVLSQHPSRPLELIGKGTDAVTTTGVDDPHLPAMRDDDVHAHEVMTDRGGDDPPRATADNALLQEAGDGPHLEIAGGGHPARSKSVSSVRAPGM